jgi:hypothetical protein
MNAIVQPEKNSITSITSRAGEADWPGTKSSIAAGA